MATEPQFREEIHFALIVALANLGEFESSLEFYQTLNRSGEPSRVGSWTTRSGSFSRIINFGGDDLRHRFIKACKDAKKLDHLLAYLQKRYEKKVDNPIIFEIVAEIYLTRREYTQAAEAYMLLSRLQPHNVRSFYYAAAAFE